MVASITIAELMVKNVIAAEPHHTAERVRGLMEKHHFHVVPVVDSDGHPVGIVSSSDLLKRDHKDGTPVSGFMTDKPLCVNEYDGPHIAARVMRNHKIHHVLVTKEKKLVGIVSAFDLLKLVEEHRYVPKKRAEDQQARPGSVILQPRGSINPR